MHRTDEALAVAYIEKDDQEAFRQLVERHKERIFGYVMGMVRDRDVANDLFQETFFRVIRAMKKERGSYASQGKWLAWTMRIARNAVFDHMRERKKWTDVETNDAQDGSFWDRLPGEPAPADEHVDMRHRIDIMEQCIERLPGEQREVLLLRHETDMTFREIAELTNVSINTALGRMRYALLNLQKMIRIELGEEAEGIRTT
jgi:RNA polymerase sigma-70 factor (ECF subfamily)